MADTLLKLGVRLMARLPRPGDDRGASLVEYALLLVLIVVVCALAVAAIGQTLNSSYSSTGSGFTR
jgi:Flp pilus assembly pilin Flp